MKNFLIMLAGALMALPAVARDFTYTYEGQTLTYTVIDEGAKTCMTKSGAYGGTPGNNVSGDLVIPSKANDGESNYTVTAIGLCSFAESNGLTSVTISEGVNSIGEAAFYRCSGLTSVTIPEGVTAIGNNAFYLCSGITSLTIPESVTTIGDDAFYYLISLTTITIPKGVTNVGTRAFSSCYGLTSVTISEGVTSIGISAFYDCTGMTSVNIPESVTTFGVDAFRNCSSLSKVTIPKGVTTIGNNAFAGCSGLTAVYYSAEEPVSGDQSIFSGETYEKATLYMTKNGAVLGKEIEPWKNFQNVDTSVLSSVADGLINSLDCDSPCEIHTLSGVKVDSGIEDLPAGLYIVRQGRTVKKIAVK